MRALIPLAVLALAACYDKTEGPEKLDSIIVLPDSSSYEAAPPDAYLPCMTGCFSITFIKQCETWGKWSPSLGHCPPQLACGKCVSSSDAGRSLRWQADLWPGREGAPPDAPAVW